MNPAPVGVASTNLALAGFEKTESSTPLLGNIFEYLNFNKKLSYCSDSAQCTISNRQLQTVFRRL